MVRSGHNINDGVFISEYAFVVFIVTKGFQMEVKKELLINPMNLGLKRYLQYLVCRKIRSLKEQNFEMTPQLTYKEQYD